jgi:AcrR family transcriptional regulator
MSAARRDSAGPPASSPRRRGPRADVEDTRGAILAAARARFSERGYDGTKLRDVAADADVDVALVSYFFGSKDGLFAASMALAVNPAELVAGLLEAGTDGLGERLLRTLLRLWDDPRSGSPFVALVRSAASHDRAAELLRGFVERELLGRIAAAIDAPEPELRAALTGSQLVGIIMARYVVRVEPLASCDPDTLVRAIGPTLQRYLTGDVAVGG